VFAEGADFIHILGGHFNGRTPIERGHRAIFDTIYKDSTNKFTVNKVRFISSDVAIVFLLAELKVAQAGLPPVLHARPTLVAKRTPDGWKIIAFQNTMVTPEGASGGKKVGTVYLRRILNQAARAAVKKKGSDFQA
jgi:uncharacterized protein (TIGR02246 family)